jgi:hypothetical protein
MHHVGGYRCCATGMAPARRNGSPVAAWPISCQLTAASPVFRSGGKHLFGHSTEWRFRGRRRSPFYPT